MSEIQAMRAPAADASRKRYAFDRFIVDAGQRRVLRADGQPLAITARVFDLLLVLIERAGRPVEKSELLERVWGDVAIEEGNLARNISTLRKLLGDSAEEPRYVVTLSGRGYQFVAPVRLLAGEREPDGTVEPLVEGAPVPHAIAGSASPARMSRTFAAALVVIGVSTLGAIVARIGTTAPRSPIDRPGRQIVADGPNVKTTAHVSSPRADDLLLLGAHYSRERNVEATSKGVDYLERAVALDPASASAHAALARAYYERDIWAGLGIGRSAARIRQEAIRAIELDQSIPEGHLALADVLANQDWDWESAEREYRRALVLNPNLAEAHIELAFLMQALRRDEEAIQWADEAEMLEPLSLSVIADHGRILYRAGRRQAAAAAFQRALRLDPDCVPALIRLTAVTLIDDKLDEGRTLVGRLERSATRLPPLVLAFFRGYLALRSGNQSAALAIARDMEAQDASGRSGERAQLLASLYASIDRQRALDWLERGVREHSLLPVQLRDPFLEPLRGEPRYMALLTRFRLPQ
jgi:DNA-binding winged helix-turn-helix (wHTH) protein/Tfp pilus assembly protein PilF